MDKAKVKFAHLWFTVVIGTRYLGGYVGDKSYMKEWVGEKVAEWTTFVTTLALICRSSPHCAFVGLTKSLQSEWCRLQRV